MKLFKFYAILGLLIITGSCQEKSVKEPTKKVVAEKPLTILDSIANAHGFQQWKNINAVDFTFNVDRNGNHFQRSWYWNTKTNAITYSF